MRTTMSISDELLIAAKARARTTGTTLGKVFEAALRRELSSPQASANRPQVPVFCGGDGPRPGIDMTSNAALHEALDEGLPLNSRR